MQLLGENAFSNSRTRQSKEVDGKSSRGGLHYPRLLRGARKAASKTSVSLRERFNKSKNDDPAFISSEFLEKRVENWGEWRDDNDGNEDDSTRGTGQRSVRSVRSDPGTRSRRSEKNTGESAFLRNKRRSPKLPPGWELDALDRGFNSDNEEERTSTVAKKSGRAKSAQNVPPNISEYFFDQLHQGSEKQDPSSFLQSSSKQRLSKGPRRPSMIIERSEHEPVQSQEQASAGKTTGFRRKSTCTVPQLRIPVKKEDGLVVVEVEF
mmetsp:Transcript_5449/g.8957  ORF Transcript_5449/g.8957 Transcript_5449/m.8957 type:complete len:265 (-) Transcript_5449:55-849(-)|eukprot:CAMPEP_0119013024 /NCGR_PEP_ID=MMETSP1176-20130426/7757_1 /TAXON_ID=265551 /ORGANISM="Synedropsis recta cf, Strain CCMP1620" /LENGTH=264 /DNA_ID=CAMNT_0006966073 /DNA_START=155 /DNA_END=949 /DNA_ORIENTATION=-